MLYVDLAEIITITATLRDNLIAFRNILTNRGQHFLEKIIFLEVAEKFNAANELSVM